jgi:hypothetical protein
MATPMGLPASRVHPATLGKGVRETGPPRAPSALLRDLDCVVSSRLQEPERRGCTCPSAAASSVSSYASSGLLRQRPSPATHRPELLRKRQRVAILGLRRCLPLPSDSSLRPVSGAAGNARPRPKLFRASRALIRVLSDCRRIRRMWRMCLCVVRTVMWRMWHKTTANNHNN